jgi:hypothetical protein
MGKKLCDFKIRLNQFIYGLQVNADDNAYVSKNGSSTTSLREEMQLGAIAREQKRIIEELQRIMREE